jgi:DNA repair exonuclease SbcCD ATPase subunit
MFEEFKEENIKGKFLEFKREGFGFKDSTESFDFSSTIDISKKIADENKKQEKDAEKLENAIMNNPEKKVKQIKKKPPKQSKNAERISTLKTEEQSLKVRIDQLKNKILEKDIELAKLDNVINPTTKETQRLLNKKKTISDQVQYYKDLIFGPNGYLKETVNWQKKYEELISKEIGKPIQQHKSEGFGSIYENYENAESEIRDLANKITTLNKEVTSVQDTIKAKDQLIEKKQNTIDNSLPKTSTKFQSEINSYLDDLQYYRTLVLGNDKMDGYATTLAKQKIKYNELNNKEFTNSLNFNNKEGVNELYEVPYETINTKEGFDTLTMSYLSVLSQNKAINDKIETTTNIHSVNNQLSSNIISKTNILKIINYVLILVFLIVYAYACYKIYKIPEMDIFRKCAIGIVVFLTIFIIHLVEYTIAHFVPFAIAFFTGVPYSPLFLLSRPGKYDYLPNP